MGSWQFKNIIMLCISHGLLAFYKSLFDYWIFITALNLSSMAISGPFTAI